MVPPGDGIVVSDVGRSGRGGQGMADRSGEVGRNVQAHEAFVFDIEGALRFLRLVSF